MWLQGVLKDIGCFETLKLMGAFGAICAMQYPVLILCGGT